MLLFGFAVFLFCVDAHLFLQPQLMPDSERSLSGLLNRFFIKSMYSTEHTWVCKVVGFWCGAVQIFVLVGCGAVSLGDWCVTF